MKRRSPTLEGFQALFRLPALGLAEIAWRWSFGLAVTALLAFSFREYLSTLPVTGGNVLVANPPAGFDAAGHRPHPAGKRAASGHRPDGTRAGRDAGLDRARLVGTSRNPQDAFRILPRER